MLSADCTKGRESVFYANRIFSFIMKKEHLKLFILTAPHVWSLLKSVVNIILVKFTGVISVTFHESNICQKDLSAHQFSAQYRCSPRPSMRVFTCNSCVSFTEGLWSLPESYLCSSHTACLLLRSRPGSLNKLALLCTGYRNFPDLALRSLLYFP